MVGVVETSDALRRAEALEMDLVEVAPESRPPVCKIMEYGKFKYEQSKKDQRNRQASKQAEMKEVRLGRSIKIDPHDVKIRVNRARKFLLDGHKVLLVQQFRGREMQHRHLGRDLLMSVVEQLSDLSKVETSPRQMGRRVSMIVAPDKNKIMMYKRQHGLKQESGADQAPDAPEADTPATPAEATAPAEAPSIQEPVQESVQEALGAPADTPGEPVSSKE